MLDLQMLMCSIGEIQDILRLADKQTEGRKELLTAAAERLDFVRKQLIKSMDEDDE